VEEEEASTPTQGEMPFPTIEGVDVVVKVEEALRDTYDLGGSFIACSTGPLIPLTPAKPIICDVGDPTDSDRGASSSSSSGSNVPPNPSIPNSLIERGGGRSTIASRSYTKSNEKNKHTIHTHTHTTFTHTTIITKHTHIPPYAIPHYHTPLPTLPA